LTAPKEFFRAEASTNLSATMKYAIPAAEVTNCKCNYIFPRHHQIQFKKKKKKKLIIAQTNLEKVIDTSN
jgi:ribosomal protein L15